MTGAIRLERADLQQMSQAKLAVLASTLALPWEITTTKDQFVDMIFTKFDAMPAEGGMDANDKPPPVQPLPVNKRNDPHARDIAMLKNAWSLASDRLDLLDARITDVDINKNDRIKALEAQVAALVARDKERDTFVGHMDNLKKPASVDSVKKPGRIWPNNIKT